MSGATPDDGPGLPGRRSPHLALAALDAIVAAYAAVGLLYLVTGGFDRSRQRAAFLEAVPAPGRARRRSCGDSSVLLVDPPLL
jgi:hypothetical protein